jgi:hypothetical protein
MGDTGSDIIIKGGSVDLSYDEATYPKNNGDPKSHKNPNKKITRVTIENGGLSYDSGDHPGGLTCTIKVTCK